MRRDLLSTMYEGVAGIVGAGPNPGASARNRKPSSPTRLVRLSGRWGWLILSPQHRLKSGHALRRNGLGPDAHRRGSGSTALVH